MRLGRPLTACVLVACALATLLVPAGASGEPDDTPTTPVPVLDKGSSGSLRLRSPDGDGMLVELDGASEGPSQAAASSSLGGYALFDSSVGIASAYTVRMVNDGGWTGITAQVDEVMAEVGYVTGASFKLGPPAASHLVTGYYEIGISVSRYSPCGYLDSEGVIGCGVAYEEGGRIVNGEVYLCGCVAHGYDAFATLLHEFAHTMDLAHYTPSYEGQHQVMYPTYQEGIVGYRSGDVNGLRRVVANGFGGGTAITHPPGATGTPGVGSGGIALLDVSWVGAPAYGKPIDQHRIEVKNTQTHATKTVTVGSSRTAHVAVTGGTYVARVRAHNSKGWGPWSGWSAISRTVPTRCVSSITDVAQSNRFCTDIAWLLDEGIASGFSDSTFRPDDDVSRQAMAAFLMRDAERLMPGSTDGDWSATTTFSDVPPDDPFHDEIEWLASTGITTGFPDGTFKPLADINRMSMAAMLQRFTEHLSPGSTAGDWSASPFPDVPPSKPFHDEITWLASTGITTGYDDGTYRPDDDVSRQAMAAFLHRLDAELG